MAPEAGSSQAAATFAVSGAASLSAVVFTNPLEVAKSRFQVQGELARSDARPYRSVLQTLWTIPRNEGLLALQKGLIPAWAYQFMGNGVRLAVFDQLKTHYGANTGFAGSLAMGASAGIVSSLLSHPFYLVKVRLQIASSAVAVGEQHHYSSLRHAFGSILRSDGVPGFWQGINGALCRSIVGSSVQLSTYSEAKSFIGQQTGGGNMLLDSFLASLLAGLAITTAMEPFDVVATRLCNQSGSGNYRGVWDCLSKTVQAEGPLGLYKGWASNYLRLGPHTVLLFTFLEQYKLLARHCGFME